MNISRRIIDDLESIGKRRPNVLVIGDANFDYIYYVPTILQPDREVIIQGEEKTLGGSGGNFASAMGRLGARVKFIGCVGNDSEGKALLRTLRKSGIMCNGIKVDRQHKTSYTLLFIEVGENKPRQFATNRGCLENFTVSDINFGGIDVVYCCSYFLFPRLRKRVGNIFKTARRNGVITSYDANSGDGWDKPENLRTLKERILPCTDIIFLNESEAKYLTGENDCWSAARELGNGDSVVCVKLGKDGCLIRDKDETIKVDGIPIPGKLVDTIGAGDTYDATFLYLRSSGMPNAWAGICACINASTVVCYPGGTAGQLDRKGILRRLEELEIRKCWETVSPLGEIERYRIKSLKNHRRV
jgi:sugar/nucleoside kinase (ribokinase family)